MAKIKKIVREVTTSRLRYALPFGRQKVFEQQEAEV